MHFDLSLLFMFWYYFIIGKKECFLDVRCLENDLLCMNEELVSKFTYCAYKLINNSANFLNTKNFLANLKGERQNSVSLQFVIFFLKYINFSIYSFHFTFCSFFLFLKQLGRCTFKFYLLKLSLSNYSSWSAWKTYIRILYLLIAVLFVKILEFSLTNRAF